MSKGISRKLRDNKALKPEFISIDERSMQDLISFTLNYAKKINYFDENNRLVGNWESFFLKDSVFIIAIISGTDIGQFKKVNDEIWYEFSGVEGLDGVSVMLKNTYHLASIVFNWRDLIYRSQLDGNLASEMENLKNEVEESLKNVHNNLAQIKRDAKGIKYLMDFNKDLLKQFRFQPSDLESSSKSEFIEIDGNLSLELLKDEFNSMYGKIIYFKEIVSRRFDEEIEGTDKHLPHIGLLLTFFKLFQFTQEQINSMTKRHLDYYYKDLLNQEPRKIDKSHFAMLALYLKQDVDRLVIDKGEGFDFNIEGVEDGIFYTSGTTQINRAIISDIKSIYKSEEVPFHSKSDLNSFRVNLLYEEDVLQRIQNNLELPVKNYEELPVLFGTENRTHSNLGFIVSSPALILEEGIQEITLEFKLVKSLFTGGNETAFDKLFNKELDFYKKKNPEIGVKELKEKESDLKENIVFKFFRKAFNISITTSNGWKDISYSQTRVNASILSIRIPLKSTADQLISFDTSLHEGEFETECPCIKIFLNNTATHHPYIFLKDLTIEYVRIVAEVSEVHNLNLSNSNGELDNTIPFTPFGSIPLKGSYLRIQNPKIFQESLYALEFSINWNGLPQIRGGFKKYYEAFENGIHNGIFKAVISEERSINKNEVVGFNLFDGDVNGYLNNRKHIPVPLETFDFKNKIVQFGGVVVKNKKSVYVTLMEPDIAFGHGVFSQIYAKAAMKSSRYYKKNIPLPNQPFTPVIDKFIVNYKNVLKENVLRKQDEDSNSIKLIHLYPFGNAVVFPGSINSKCHLFPQIDKKGNLFIGLEKAFPEDIVSIGFELIPAVYFHSVVNVPIISWKYLHNNVWEDLTGSVIEDETKGLIKSGIIKIVIPSSIQYNNTRLSSGKFWIKAEYDGDEELNSRVINIFTQAILVSSQVSLSRSIVSEKLPQKGSHIKPIKNKEIEKVVGPIHMVFDENTQKDTSFYSRVSEQLRHKKRGITNWDMERMILDQFHEIEKVRVYGRNKYPHELVKGSTTQIVVIPKNHSVNQTLTQGNKLDICTLNEIKKYLFQFVSPYVKIEVSNPVYELLKVRCRIEFRDFQRSNYLKIKLNNELISYLSPDIDSLFVDKGFEESYTKTEIFNFIAGRPYVSSVLEFSVIQLVGVIGKHKIINTKASNNERDRGIIETLRTISPYAILTSVKKHHIEIFDPVSIDKSIIGGIGDVAIGSDFIIIDQKGNYIKDEL
jgi:hypothetical protein